MQTVAKIRLRKPTRVFPFLASDIQIKRNETCIVRSDRGLEFGTCVVPPEPCSPEVEGRYNMSVVRKTNPQDESTFQQILLEEKKAHTLCAAKISERRLLMKLVDVEYTFDKHKVIFYFTAADRVDFRELVRDLAHELKTRIELRHIQVRDEAKLVGGLGVCGRELCCSTWLREFMPISMKMAKRQNLSLNPSKISGQCGRLLCCLSYENDMYRHAKKTRAAEDQAAAAIVDDNDLEEAVAASDEDFPWQEPTREVASVVTDEHIHGPSPRIEDEARHASSVVDISADEADEDVIVLQEDGIDVTIVDLPHGGPGAPQEPAGANGHDGPRKRKRRRRRRPGSGAGGGSSTAGN